MKKLLLLFAAICHLTTTWGADTVITKTLTFSAMAEVYYSFDFAKPPPGPLRITGVDNNGNRINSTVE